jgi:RsiW-degrading membrane proteinase PrsW (M82 family)
MDEMLIFATVIAFGTALLWARLFLRRDKFSPEPLRLLASLFFAGCLVTLPAAYIEQRFSVNDLVRAAVIAPVVEEVLKLTAIVLICSWSRHFNQVVDGAIYGISCGLGFAAVENLLFGLNGGFGVLALRVLVGPMTHALYTGVTGLFFARAAFEHRPALMAFGLLLGVGLHAGWNFTPGLVAHTGNEEFAVMFVFVLLSYIWLLRGFMRHLEQPEMLRLRTALALGEVGHDQPQAPNEGAAAG